MKKDLEFNGDDQQKTRRYKPPASFVRILTAGIILSVISVAWLYFDPLSEYGKWFSRISHAIFYIGTGSLHFNVRILKREKCELNLVSS
jgi:hypothetical protein